MGDGAAASPGPPEGGVGRGRPPKKKQGKEEVRMMDIRKKKENRRIAKALIQDIWALEAELRRAETPARAPGRNKMHSVLQDLVLRVRGMKRGGRGGAGREAGHGGPVDEEMRRALLNSGTLGALYISVEDWQVRESSKGMELVCPLELLRGYVGYELHAFVHSDDQPALRTLSANIQSFNPSSGKQRAPAGASLRLLRACADGGVLVMDYARLRLEVVHVGRDEEQGGRVHALLTCILEPDDIAPLKFTTLDRVRFQLLANTVSGTFVPESYDGFKGGVAPLASPEAASEEADGGGSSVHKALNWLLCVASSSLRYIDVLKLARIGFFPIVRKCVRLHLMLGVAPDGVPWCERSVAVEALGISSGYRPYVVARMASCIGWTSLFTREEPKPFLMGVMRERTSPDEGGAIGVAGLIFDVQDTPTGKRPVAIHTRNEYSHHPVTGVRFESHQLFFHGHRGSQPDRLVLTAKSVGPPNRALLAEFCKFDLQRASGQPVPGA